MQSLEEIGKRARAAEAATSLLDSFTKRQALMHVAGLLTQEAEAILQANALDLARAREQQMPSSLQDRLLLNNERIEQMAEGVRQVAALDDPIGSVSEMKKRPNGLLIGKMRVPIGVIGIIYESRPNVTVDAFALTFQTGNVAILKGGSDAIESNKMLVSVLRRGLSESGCDPDALLLVEQTDRETTTRLMRMQESIDLLIPRGGAGLIRTVKENSTIPVIETGTGNCHIYVDESADLAKAVPIIVNAKTQRLGVCNACESLVVHASVLEPLLAALVPPLMQKQVELRCDARAFPLVPHAVAATEDDWGCEYLDAILSVRTVDSLEEAIAHINRYNTKHSEAILTENYSHAQQFLRQIDAACVYVNASTRFTDGYEFGYGAEIGISTQKLHARGPMGLDALTTTKYIIYGNGQVRP